LLHYVGLELKDRPSLALREHVSLFAAIDHQWKQWWLDGPPAPRGESPSACYARTLRLTLAGSLEQDAADVYLGLHDLLDEMGPTGSPPSWGVAYRLRALRMLTDRRLGAEADPEALRAAFGSLERPRFGSLRFWLRIAPPPAPPDPSDDLARRPSASSR